MCKIQDLASQFGTLWPKMNGAIEPANKNIKKILEKMTVTYKDWHEKLSFALHAYRTSIRTSTGVTSYSLDYRMEEIPSFVYPDGN